MKFFQAVINAALVVSTSAIDIDKPISASTATATTLATERELAKSAKSAKVSTPLFEIERYDPYLGLASDARSSSTSAANSMSMSVTSKAGKQDGSYSMSSVAKSSKDLVDAKSGKIYGPLFE